MDPMKFRDLQRQKSMADKEMIDKYIKLSQKQKIFAQQRQPQAQQEIRCPFCSEIEQSRNHQQLCEHRPIPCQYCGESYYMMINYLLLDFPASLVPAHELQCEGKQKHAELLRQLTPKRITAPRRAGGGSQRVGASIDQFFGRAFNQISEGINSIGVQFQQWAHRPQREDQVRNVFEQLIDYQDQPSRSPHRNHHHHHHHHPHPNNNNNNNRRFPPRSNNINNNNAKNGNNFALFKFSQRPNLSPSAKSCAICQSEFEEGEQVKLLHCAHRYHEECVDKWLKEKQICPVCKRNIFDQ